MADIVPPQSKTELLQRARALAGLSLQQLAEQFSEDIPSNTTHAKGWLGQLLEKSLGATAGSLAQPDFLQLGVELKTLPLTASGKPKESTYVCTVPLTPQQTNDWQHSWLRQKLQTVLWLPVEADKRIALAQRRIGCAILWTPSAEDEQLLRQDWEELMELVCLGQLDQISSHFGNYLQIRPKAANAKALTETLDAEGRPIKTLPRGFYLRPCFTQRIIEQSYIASNV